MTAPTLDGSTPAGAGRPRLLVIDRDHDMCSMVGSTASLPLDSTNVVSTPDAHDSWVDDTRRVLADRRGTPPGPDRRDLISAVVLGASFTVVAIGLAVASDEWSGRNAIGIAIAFVALVLANRVAFESGPGSAVATQPVLVATLFVIPLELVPLVVLASALAVDPNWLRGVRPRVLFVTAATGWHCVGPVAVLAAAEVERPDADHVGVLVAALAAQFAIDALVGVIRCRALRIPLGELGRGLRWSFAVDALLAPLGVAAVLATDAEFGAFGFALAPVALLALLSYDRDQQLERAVVMSEFAEDAMAQARRDPLTGLSNRRAWNEAIAHVALRQAVEPGLRVAVLLGDLDGLKHVNDEQGHDAGDLLITAAAQVWRDAAPAGAVVARLGGDEFGALVTAAADDPDGGDVERLVGRLRGAVTALPPLGPNLRLSMSIGGASCPPVRSVESAVIAADELVFADKRRRSAGRA
jgi:diguanylate cyclase (GGDEF)-like protein